MCKRSWRGGKKKGKEEHKAGGGLEKGHAGHQAVKDGTALGAPSSWEG